MRANQQQGVREEGRFGRKEGARGLVRSRGLKAGDTAQNTVRAKRQSGGKVSSGLARKGHEWREPINFEPTLDAGRRGYNRKVQRCRTVLCRIVKKDKIPDRAMWWNPTNGKLTSHCTASQDFWCVHRMVPTTLRASMTNGRQN